MAACRETSMDFIRARLSWGPLSFDQLFDDYAMRPRYRHSPRDDALARQDLGWWLQWGTGRGYIRLDQETRLWHAN